MTSSDFPPPPPHNPYVTPSSPPPPYPPYQPQPTHRPAWSWRSIAAGAVAGGVLTAMVAVPVTWAVTSIAMDQATDAPSSQQQTVPETPETPQTPDGQSPFGTDPFGGGSTSEQSGDWEDATSEQAQGVVLINTRTTSGAGAGTGLVLESDGLVLTNYHVVEGSTEVQVTVASTGVQYVGTVVGHDQEADVALVQLTDASDLDTVKLDDDGDPAVSDEVTAVGNAQGQGFLSAAPGEVVALDQSIDTQAEGPVAGEHLTGLIQTDAYVVGGFSGGALLDDEGEVVGITTAASSGGATESYAVPIESALDVVEQIEDGDEGDGVQVGPSAYLGLSLATDQDGVQVAQVQSGGAAQEAGVQAGATITGLGDAEIASYDDLRQALATHEPGDSVALRWTDAEGQSHEETVTLGESPVN
jgi:S1-C subfamily serine protease